MRSDKVRHDDTSRYVMMIRHDATGLCLRVVRHDGYHDVQLAGLCLRDAYELWNGGVCGSLAVYTRCNASVAVVLQHVVAVRCSVLRCVAAYVRVLSHGPLKTFRRVCNTLQQTATRCYILQHTATPSNALEHVETN